MKKIFGLLITLWFLGHPLVSLGEFQIVMSTDHPFPDASVWGGVSTGETFTWSNDFIGHLNSMATKSFITAKGSVIRIYDGTTKTLIQTVQVWEDAGGTKLRWLKIRDIDEDGLDEILLTCYSTYTQGYRSVVVEWVGSDTSIITQDEVVPQPLKLKQNFSNPFKSSTTIRYHLPIPSHIVLQIYDVEGRKIKTIVNGQQDAGNHTVKWDGCDEAGRHVASGTYFYEIRAGDATQNRKMIMLK